MLYVGMVVDVDVWLLFVLCCGVVLVMFGCVVGLLLLVMYVVVVWFVLCVGCECLVCVWLFG